VVSLARTAIDDGPLRLDEPFMASLLGTQGLAKFVDKKLMRAV
jgi:hypothetical protein